MKQTAVQWLIEHLNLDETSPNYNKLTIEKAKEMFEQQIIDAYTTSHISMMSADQYYYETFKQK